MRPQPKTQTPPATRAELLALLRAARLIDEDQAARLRTGWGEGPVGPCLDELVHAGILTAYQAEQVAAGRPRRLRLGPYRLLDRLPGGRGVFRAKHLLLHRLVVLKVLGRSRRRRPNLASPSLPTCNDPLPTPPSTPPSPPPTRREVEACAQLDHPHIVAAHHATRLRGRLVLVLEHIDGADLARLVAETGPLPIDLACEVTRQAALALDHLHARGLVHRDVKPANLVLSRTGPDARPLVKLLDLGLACPTGTEDELCGTMDFLAPERGMGRFGCTPRADLYGLGCTLYFLLTGQVPFPGGNWTAKLLRHCLDDAEPVRSLRPGVPPEVAALVARLMARSPDHRPASAGEVAEALAALARPAPPAARPLPPPPPPPPPGTSSPLRWLAAAALVLGLAAGGVARWAITSPPPDDAQASAPALHAPAPPASSWRLDEALAAADDGATVTVPAGTHLVAPARVRGKRLTLRAAPDAEPVLQRAPDAARWEALIDTDRDLELAGLALRGQAAALAPLVHVEGAALTLRGCRLDQAGPAPLVACRRGPRVELERCHLSASQQAVAVEAGGPAPVAVRLATCELAVTAQAGTAVLLWADELSTPARATVAIEGSTARAGRVLACRALAGPVGVRATRNHFAFREALVSLDGYGDRAAWRHVLDWSGQGNRFESGGAWMRLEGSLEGRFVKQNAPPSHLP